MDNKINILGIELDDYSLDEAMNRTMEYLDNDALDIVGIISHSLMKFLIERQEGKEFLKEVSMSIIGEPDILDASRKEVRDGEGVPGDDYLQSVFRFAQVKRKSIYILGDTQEAIKEVENYLNQGHSGIIQVGAYSLEQCKEEEDNLINEINGASPDIIVSYLPCEEIVRLALEHHTKINSKLWIAIAEDWKLGDQPIPKKESLWRLIDKIIFKRRISKYNKKRGK